MQPMQLSYRNVPGAVEHDATDTMIMMYNGAMEMLDTLVRDYEAGEVIVFSDAFLQMSNMDWALINAVNPPATQDNQWKKAKMKNLTAPLVAGKDHVLDYFFKDRKDAARLQELMTRVTDQLRARVKAAFPAYKFLGESVTWRLTQTEGEAMHFDAYGNKPDDLHHVRVFVNLDTHPRLWGVGPKIQDAIEKYHRLFAAHLDEHPNVLNNTVNTVLPWDEIPRHFVAFAPNNMWLVNSQIVAHEIIWGRKMIACTFDVDPASMKNLDHSFQSVVRSAIEKVKDAKS